MLFLNLAFLTSLSIIYIEAMKEIFVAEAYLVSCTKNFRSSDTLCIRIEL